MTASPRIRVLFDEKTIASRIEELAQDIARAKPENLLVVAILKGSFMFAADLIRALHRVGPRAAGRVRPSVELSRRNGVVRAGGDPAGRGERRARPGRPAGRRHPRIGPHRDLRQGSAHGPRRARRVLTTVLLEKPGKRAVSIDAEFVGFNCPDVFVVGYGMDVSHSYRQLPFVGVVDHLDSDPDLFDEKS